MGFIYKITNDINNKVYIGKTEWSIEKRFKEHLRDANKQYRQNRPLYRAIHKYGQEHFSVEEIEEVSNELLDEREQYWIEYYHSYHFGYNGTKGGDGKRLYDYDDICDYYEKTKNQKATAIYFNIDPNTVKRALEINKIQIIPSNEQQIIQKGKKINQYDLNKKFIQSFRSGGEAGKYIVNNHLSKGSAATAAARIREACNKPSKTAYGYFWEFD